MIFRYYFLKEGTRVYDRAEFVTYLTAQHYITFDDEGSIKKAYYHNPVLNFDATFVMSNRSIIDRIERLNPKYLDVNLYVEFDVLSSTYKVNRLVDSIKELCEKFDFAVYNEYFEDVSKFDRSLLINDFNLVKNAYKKKYDDDFVNIKRLSQDSLEKVYGYLENKDQIENDYKAKSLEYEFLGEEATRNAYVCLNLDLSNGTIIPPGCKLVKIQSEDGYFITSFDEVYKKIGKFFESVTSTLPFNVLIVKEKYIRKINKILTKTNFNKVMVPLNGIELSKILDL